MEGVLVCGLSQQDIDSPEVGLPVEDGILVIDALIVDMQLVEVLGILEVVLIACGLQEHSEWSEMTTRQSNLP